MANSLKDKFDANGSPLSVPVSPNPNPTTDPAINVQGESLLHNQYSNIGDPGSSPTPYKNGAFGAMGYSTPSPSALGERTELYQSPTNRYKNNAPEGRTF